MSDLEGYDYYLPKELIAQWPLVHRADARLLVVDRDAGALSHRHIRDLPDILRASDCLVINDTRVVPARLIGERAETGGRWEGLFLSLTPEGHWKLLCKSRGRLAPGESIELFDASRQRRVRLFLLEKQDEGVWLAHPRDERDAWTILDEIGQAPLPHYIRGGQEETGDRDRYQTVFARWPGAVAAPTAGLHFTQELLAKLEGHGTAICRVTLHVGLDTFRPITVGTLAEHRMHREWCQLLPDAVETIERSRAAGGRLVAVGTTSVRTLETAAAGGTLAPWAGATELFIRPPYRFRVVDALLTNFHLPRTTLLVLVRTFGGDELIVRAYEEAIRERYRFYSYGDAMLIL